MSSAPWGSAGSMPSGIAFAGGDELRAGDAEGGVGAGIAEVPGELFADDFDLQRGEGRLRCSGRRPRGVRRGW